MSVATVTKLEKNQGMWLYLDGKGDLCCFSAGRMSRLSSWIILPAFLSAFMARVMLTRWAPVRKLRSSCVRGNWMTIPWVLSVPMLFGNTGEHAVKSVFNIGNS